MLYYFVEFAGSFANIALLLLFIGRLFSKKEPVSRWFYLYVVLFVAGQCDLSLFPDWVTQRTIYLLVGGSFLALLFYEVRPWQAVFASGAFFTLIALVEVLAMLLIGLRIPDTDILMQAGAARLVYVVFSNLIQIPLVVLISHFFSRKGKGFGHTAVREEPLFSFPKKTKNPNPSPIEKRFGFSWFGAREGTRTPKDKPHAPQTCASASSATLAYHIVFAALKSLR